MWSDRDTATHNNAPLAARQTLKTLAASNGKSIEALARLIGRSPAYLEQYLNCGWPRLLPNEECRVLAHYFGVDEQSLGARNPWKRSA